MKTKQFLFACVAIIIFFKAMPTIVPYPHNQWHLEIWHGRKLLIYNGHHILGGAKIIPDHPTIVPDEKHE
jgi:hypothetical protein